jgi:adenylosuccinate synthase
LRYSAQVNGLSCLALGHLDVLSGLDQVNICVGYRNGTGAVIPHLPSDLPFRTELEPVYETLPGWSEDLSEVRTLEALPANARRYIQRVQELTGVPISSVSVGPGREQTILVDDVLERTCHLKSWKN